MHILVVFNFVTIDSECLVFCFMFFVFLSEYGINSEEVYVW